MSTPLVDGYGRVHRDLRISVTDRCNFRCALLHAGRGDGVAPPPAAAHLRGDRAGGQGLRRALRVRLDPPHRWRAHRAGPPPGPGRASCPASMSTWRSPPTAPRWRLLADALADGGPATDQHVAATRCSGTRFAELTRRDELHQVLDGIAAAKRAGLDPVKVNVVVMRGVNDDEIVDFATFGRQQGVDGAIHRVHAARRRWRMVGRPGGAGGRDAWPPSTRCTRSSRWPTVTSRRNGSATATAAARSA